MSIRKNLKRVLPFLLCAVIATSTFAGCGNSTGGSTSTGDASTAGSSTGAASTSSESAPAETGTATGDANILRYGTTSIEGRFNPIMSDNVYDGYVVDCIFESLIITDEEGIYVPSNIATYEMSEDNRTYTFTLKDGVTFSDGTPMTTEDVKFTYEAIGHPDYTGPRGYAIANLEGIDEFKANYAGGLSGIQIIDEKTISFTYQEASPANIADLVYGIMPKHYYEFENFADFTALMDKPLGSGRMVLDAFEPKQYTQMSRNETYWDTSTAAKIDGILINDVPKESLLGAMQTGQIDFCQPDANEDNYAAFNDLSNASARTFVGNGYTFMAFNTTRPTLSDVRTRQALMYALDRETFIDAVYGPNLASVGLAPFSPTSWAFPDVSELNAYPFDMDKAQQLMSDAGWNKESDGYLYKDGQKFSVTWLVYTEAEWPGVLSGLAADSWKQLGVDLTIELLDFNTVSDRTMDAPVGDKDFDIYTMGFSLSADPDPKGALFDADAYTEGGFNATGYRNDRAQELIALGRTEFDQAKREEYYVEFAKLMNEEIPTVIVAYRNEIWAINDRINGMDFNAFKKWPFFLDQITLSE
ncbi:ABC transporter substrate-binding protein [Ruminococcaceae bacterium OttesenSCG-928-L11]|nr:ABC transporter substrate-binding protein [Ruminococcaceae bacterium OttesenSCG-928-L11]